MAERTRTTAVNPLDRKIEALRTAADLGEGRVPAETLALATDVVERARTRRRLSADHTVVGFFGATGSGKSSLFNAVTGHRLARVAATRPTTAEPMAAVWGAEGSEPLLDWLEVTQRHPMTGPAPGGLIMLDLPDIDSIAREHRDTAARLAGQVDVLVWVVDPQKYADATLHRDFLAPLSAHRGVTLVVLNQVDRLAERDVDAVVSSLTDILARDGIVRVPVLPVSATTGEGVDALRTAISSVVKRRGAATERLLADVRTAARALGAEDAGGVPAGVVKGMEADLTHALAQSAGADTVVRAVQQSYRLEAARRTGWPVVRWMSRVRQDPLRRLGLRRGGSTAPDDPRVHRTSLPERSPAQLARADGAIRALTDQAGRGAPESWRAAIRRAGRTHADTLPDELDQAISSTDLRAGAGAWWWHVVNALQWLALAAAVAGLAWLGVLAGAAYLQFELPPAPRAEGFPIPTLLLVGGLLLGILLALLTAPLVSWAARGRARRARRRLRASVATVARARVVDPVRAEVERYGAFREALAAASGRH